jgi:elongation factor P
MALLQYSEIRERKIIIYNNEPCEVLESHVARTQQRKPQNQVKLKSLINGRTFNETFHTSDTAEEADLIKRDLKFLYANRGEYWFSDPENPKDRFQLPEALLGDMTKKFLKENEIVTALVWDDDGEEKTINIKLPIKMDFMIKDAPPAIKGNTASGGNKPVTLENGAVVNVPLFLEAGNKIRVNTETGEYVERA